MSKPNLLESSVLAVTLPVVYVLLGGSGDLASRHLIPSLYRLWKAGKLPPKFLIMGVGLSLQSNDQYRDKILQQMIALGFVKPDDWEEFAQHLKWHYLNLDENDLPGYVALKQRLIEFDNQNGDAKWIYYGAIPPKFFSPVVEYLALAEMLNNPNKQVIAIEKPIAIDIESGEQLRATILKHCHPGQVVCVEHFALKPMATQMQDFITTHPVIELFQPKDIASICAIAKESIGVPSDRINFFDGCPTVLDMHSHLLIPMLSQAVVSLANRHS